MPDHYYSTPESVIDLTGVRPEQLQKEDETSLKEILKEWLADAKVLIDKHIKRDLTEEIANETDHNKLARLQKDLRICNNAALRITANMVSQAYMRRNSPYVRENDYNIKKNDDTIFTESIKEDLDPLIQTPVNTSNSGAFGMIVVDTNEEGDEAWWLN